MDVEFEWDEAKRLNNIEKHGIDFLRADLLFESAYLLAPAKTVHGEQRWLAIGVLDDVHVTVVFTKRSTAIRLISMRRARDEERREYQTVFGS
jgi:uncharacterized DUF497 family protein